MFIVATMDERPNVPTTTILTGTIAAGGCHTRPMRGGLGPAASIPNHFRETVYLAAGQTAVVYGAVSTGTSVLKGTAQVSILSIESVG